MNSYTFRLNGPKPSIDAQTIGEELERIEADYGFIDPHVVLDESRPEDAPLHVHFEWDDARAAEKWRLEQSRSLIRSVEILRDPEDESTRTIGFINVPSSGGYVSSAVIQQRADLYDEAVMLYRSRAGAAATQARKVEDLAPSDRKAAIRRDRKMLEKIAAGR